MQINGYMESIQANLLAQCTVAKNWMVPRYFKFLFQLIIQGEKSYICEHDLFVFIQELEGMAPGNKEKARKDKIIGKLDGSNEISASIMDVNLSKNHQESDNIFT